MTPRAPLCDADFGGGPLTSAGFYDAFVVKLDPLGAHLWSKRFGDLADQEAKGVAVNAASDVVVTGVNSSKIDLGGGAIASAGGYDVFTAKLDKSGAHLWSKGFGGVTDDDSAAVTFDAAGAVVQIGLFSDSIDFGGGALTSGGFDRLFVAKLDATGAYVAAKGFLAHGFGVAADAASGDVVVTGYYDGTIDFGGGPLTSAGGYDVFVARFDGALNPVWSRRFGDANDQMGQAVAIDGAGHVAVVGSFWGTVDFGGGTLTSGGFQDVFVAEITP